MTEQTYIANKTKKILRKGDIDHMINKPMEDIN